MRKDPVERPLDDLLPAADRQAERERDDEDSDEVMRLAFVGEVGQYLQANEDDVQDGRPEQRREAVHDLVVVPDAAVEVERDP